MRVRLAASLLVRALATTVMGSGLLLVVGVLLAVLGGLVIGGMLLWVVDVVIDPSVRMVIGSFLLGAAVTLLVEYGAVRSTVRTARTRLLSDARIAKPDEDERIVSISHRVASGFDRPLPTLRIHAEDTPLAFTLRHEDAPTLVVSEGLLRTLSDDELEAVVAHELAHLANGDLRLMRWAIVPLLSAEEFRDWVTGDPSDPRELPWRALGWVLVAWAKLSVGLFSRGREFAADAAAVEVTGDPSALAAALERLDRTTAIPPSDDLRAHARSVDALSVVPALDPDHDAGGGLFATHPSTETRIGRLQKLAQ